MIVNTREQDCERTISRIQKIMQVPGIANVTMGLTLALGYWLLGTVPEIIKTLWPYLVAMGVLMTLAGLVELVWRRMGWPNPKWLGPTRAERQAAREAAMVPEVIEAETLMAANVRIEWWPGTTRRPQIKITPAGSSG